MASHRRSILLLLVAFLPACATERAMDLPIAAGASAEAWAKTCKPWDDWDAPGPPFRLHGNTWYVGTCGITALLVATDDGLVLLDTGTEAGADIVLGNIRALGLDPRAVKLILSSHEHFDHVGGLARLRRATGAEVVGSEGAADVLRTGKSDPRDPQHGLHAAMAPVEVGRTVAPGGTISLGGVAFTAIGTPGHTPGALSWTWRSCAADDCRTVVYADSLSPISREGYRFSDHPGYLAAYRSGLDRLAAADCDILLTPHPSASSMVERAAAGFFEQGPSCESYAGSIRQRLEKRLSEEALHQRPTTRR